jgi:serine/threonine-protein kinase
VAAPLDPQLQAALGTSYTLDGELGRGGMATVYLARDTKHGRQVALKVLHADLAASLGPERFRREITFAATLQHPHILTVLDSGETASGQLWFTMPYVQGETLRQRIRREHQLPLDDALRITREVAGALDYAHRQGVVHRDIKPENILLTADGNALVADFGIARSLTTTAPGAGSDGTAATSLTQTGAAVGTPQYMSPEQASGDRDIGPRSDVYSLGTVLYEMLAGEPPFTGPNAQAIIAKMLSGEAPSVRRIRASVPEWVDAALARALASVPSDRWPTAGAFSRALDPVHGATTGGGLSAARPAARRVPAAALVLVLGLVIGGGALFAWRWHGGVATSATGGPIRIAVLPFDNAGDSAHAYFADGLTDALRGKLAIVPNVEVIARGSSSQYRNSTKPDDQIGRELGVGYLLTGRVRWANDRVEVSPELVQITDGKRATTKWEQQYDTTLTDVFGVQASIATQVAKSLGTTLGAGAQLAIAERPTTNAAAYDAYLKGQDALHDARRTGNLDALRRAIADYQLAVNYDSTFALAWASLGAVESFLAYSAPNATLEAKSLADIQRSLALKPDLATGHAALSAWYGNLRDDGARAHQGIVLAVQEAPHDVDILVSRADDDRIRGFPDSAITILRHALVLDPRSVFTISRLARALAMTGRYGEAESMAERGLTIDSTVASFYTALWHARLWREDYAGASDAINRQLRNAPSASAAVQRVVTYLAVGDLDSAQAFARALPPWLDQQTGEATIALVDDMYWVLGDDRLRALLAIPPDKFTAMVSRGTQRRDWSLLQAHVAALHGDSARARAWADTARRDGLAAIALHPRDGQNHFLLGVAYAYLGQADDALRETRLGAKLEYENSAREAWRDGYVVLTRARVFMLLNQQDSAVTLLDQVAHMKGFYVTPAWLRIDPTWTPLRANPAFQRLTKTEKPLA